MRNYKYLLALLFSVAALSSCNKTSVKGSFTTVPSGKAVIAKTVEGTAMKVVDTLKLAKDGSFKFNPQVVKGEPEFFYLYYGDTKIASLLLAQGDKVEVQCDTLGYWTVSGSEDCEILRQNDLELGKLAAQGSITLRQYIEYYRQMMKFVLSNSHSLTVVPVLFSTVGDTPVFSQLSDGVVFGSVADSLETVYPNSKYIKLLRNEANVRYNQLEINTMIQNAEQASYVDLNFDGMEGKPVVLSEILKKATLLVFWDASDASNKMFNAEVLKPLYEKYSKSGLEIYQVNVGADKSTWAMVVREQELPWVSVCDTYGRSISVYGVTSVPTVILLHNNTLDRLEKIDAKSLETKISTVLK